jgi:hypothetical protein
MVVGMVLIRGGVVVAVLVGFAACGGSQHRASAPITGLFASTAPTTAPAVVTTRPLTAVRPCAGRDVSVTRDFSEAAGSTMLVLGYNFTNKTHATCMLGGFPRSVVATELGMPSVVARHTRFKQDLPPGDVAPGKAGILVVYAPRCRSVSPPTTMPRHVYDHLVVSLPGGGQVDVPVALDLSCGGFSVDPLGVRLPTPPA